MMGVMSTEPFGSDQQDPHPQASGIQNSVWPDPQPITDIVAESDYPIDELPSVMRNAVQEVQDYAKAPMSLIASSALLSASLVCQAHINIIRDTGLSGPVSLSLLTIADSGERKTFCDNKFMQPIREYEEKQRLLNANILARYKTKIEAWEIKKRGLVMISRIKQGNQFLQK